MKKLFPGSFPCLVCGVDSGPIRTFLWVFVGAFVLGSVFLWLWSLGKRQGTEAKYSRLAIDADSKGDERG